MNSSQSNNPSKFIPILTEVIDEPDQSSLDFEIEVKRQGQEREKGQVLFNVFDDDNVLAQSSLKQEEPGFSHSFAQPVALERAEPEPDEAPMPRAFSQKNVGAKKETLNVKPNMDWQDRPAMPIARTEKVNEAIAKIAQEQETAPDSYSHLDDDIPEVEEVFSPISHNPLAKEDQLRPSDLMLVALTERISSKVRMRVSKDLDAHIQNKIFPLLDSFADQLVKHLEIDLLKLIREGIAEATREELERLSQRGKK
jgi:hypothetical protein